MSASSTAGSGLLRLFVAVWISWGSKESSRVSLPPHLQPSLPRSCMSYSQQYVQNRREGFPHFPDPMLCLSLGVGSGLFQLGFASWHCMCSTLLVKLYSKPKRLSNNAVVFANTEPPSGCEVFSDSVLGFKCPLRRVLEVEQEFWWLCCIPEDKG